jgi:hypothetical protein
MPPETRKCLPLISIQNYLVGLFKNGKVAAAQVASYPVFLYFRNYEIFLATGW